MSELTVPKLGFGTYKLQGDQCVQSVQTALDTGYRFLDTAQKYGNESAVGEGVNASSVPNDEVTVATKLWIHDLSRRDVLSGGRKSRDRLGVDSIDLLYVHWPGGNYDAEETLSALAELRDDGLIEHIGVCNFIRELLEEAIDVCPAPIAVNQTELHPLYRDQDELRAFCSDAGVDMVAFCPLARSAVFGLPTVRRIAEKHDATPAQISLAWVMEKGVTPIPKATRDVEIEENWAALEVDLSEDDIAAIDDIEETYQICDPDFAPW